MKQPAKFWDKIAEKYSNQPISDEAAYQKKLEVTRQYLTPEMEVLEFGCGTGATAIAHAPFAKHILASDISPKMLDFGRSKAKAANIKNVEFKQAALEDLNVQDQTLDAVLGMSILHLLEDMDGAISSVYQMLKPGGVFVTSTACLGDNLKIFKLIAPIGRFLGLIPLVRVFSEAELVRRLTDAGFEIAYQWRPEKAIAVFIVAKKPAKSGEAPR